MNKLKKSLALCITFFTLAVVAGGCMNADLTAKRQEAINRSGTITVGVPVPLEFAQANTNFLQGLEMARDEINADGVQGKTVELEIVDDEGNFRKAVDIAQSFSSRADILAVIGHWYSEICIPVSSIYEDAELLAIVPTVSNPEVTSPGYQYVFQSIVSDKKIAQEMCAYAKSQGYQKVVVYYEESSYGSNLADAIEAEAQSQDIKVLDRVSGLVTEEQYQKSYDKWKALECEATLLAVNMEEGGSFINTIRSMDPQMGIIAADGLDVAAFTDIVGDNAANVAVATTYSPYNDRAELAQFTARYTERYQEDPDVWAIQGYEALQLIVYAIEQTNSYSPTTLAEFLHNMESWQGVSEAISFNEYGEIDGREVYMKAVKDGQFQYLDY